MNVLIAALLVASLAEPVPAKRVDQVVVSNPETTNVHVEVMCDYPVYQTVDDVSTNVFREALSDGTYVWKTNVWRTSKQIVTGYTPRVQVASFSAAPGHSVFTNANSQLDIVEGMRVFADAGPAKVTLAYALATSASSISGLVSSKLDKADVIDPASATTNGPAADAKATKDALDTKLATVCLYEPEEHPEYGGSTLRWIDGYSGLGFGYGTGGTFYPEITFTDTPYGEIRHVGMVNLSRPWSWITIGNSTDENTLQDALDAKVDKADITAINPTFSNAVLAVGLNIDTNSVAVLNEIAETFGGFPLEGTATTVGGLLAALAAAVAWLKKNKVGSFDSVGGATAAVDNGVAKLDDFFTESNSLLNARITYERNATGLKDRAFNTLTFDGTEYNLSTALESVTPTASGQPRDLLIVATATAATTISFTAGTIKGDKPTIDGEGTWLITLTEYAANTWYCRQIKMEDAA